MCCWSAAETRHTGTAREGAAVNRRTAFQRILSWGLGLALLLTVLIPFLPILAWRLDGS